MRPKFKGPIKLDIGCGEHKKEGYIGVDKIPFPGVDVVHNIEDGLPFGNNSVDIIYAKHALEHLYKFDFVMDEIWRVLKPDGILEVIVPHWASCTAHSEFHTRFFIFNSFNSYDDNYNESFKQAGRTKFKILERKFMYTHRIITPYNALMNFISNIHPSYFDNFLAKFFPPSEIYFKLKAVK